MASRPNRSRASTPATIPPTTNAPDTAATANVEINVDLLSMVLDATNSSVGFLSIDPVQASLMAEHGLIVVNRTMVDAEGNIAAKANVVVASAFLASLDTSDAPPADEPSPWSSPAPAGAIAAAPAVVSSSPAFEIDDDVPLPKLTRNMSATAPKYPFDALQIGQSFHILKTAEMPDPKRTLASTVSVTNMKHSFPMKDEHGAVIIEDQSYNETQRDPVTNVPLKDANGEVITKRVEKSGPKLGYHKKFKVVTVDAKDKRGEGARVFRIEPTA